MEKLEDKFGGIYSFINYEKIENRIVPILFLLKRIAFAYGAFYIKLELLPALSIITMINVSFVLHAKPFIDPETCKLEVFNEVFAVLFFNSLLIFRTEFVKPLTQIKAGWFSIAILLYFLAYHMGRNFAASIKEGIKSCKLKLKARRDYKASLN